ncbi:hypothetical protein BH24ACI5_BH24ACI5_23560 [soil metagenome]
MMSVLVSRPSVDTHNRQLTETAETLTRAGNAGSLAGMSNVFDDETQQQIRALGRLGWTLSRIQATTGIRRETISGYLKAAGIVVRGRGRSSEAKPKPAIRGRCPPTPGRHQRPP